MGNTGTAPELATRRTINVMVMRVDTRFTTSEQFISSYHQMCTATTCFIPTHDGKHVGVESGFSIRLADGTPMLRGQCVVEELWTTGANPFKRAGVLLGIRSLTLDSRHVYQQLQLARLATVPAAASFGIVPAIDTIPNEAPHHHVAAIVDATPTIEMPSLFEVELGGIECTLHDDQAGELGVDVDAAGIPIDDEAHPTERMTGGLTVPISRRPLATILGIAPLIQPRPRGPGPLSVVVATIVDGPIVTELVRTASPAPGAARTPRRWWSRIATVARAASALMSRAGQRLSSPLRSQRTPVVSRPRVRRERVVLRAITDVRVPGDSEVGP